MSNWTLCQYDQIDHLEKSFTFKKYSSAMAFCNLVAGLAETHVHHPRMVIEWGKVTVSWGTHKSKSGSGVLSIDKAMTERCDELFELLHQPLASLP